MKQLMTKFVSRCAVVVGTFALVLSSCTVSDVEADIDALDEKYEELASTQVADTESQTEALEAAFAEAETLISEQSDALTTLREEMEAEIASLKSDIENNYVTKEELAAEVEALEEEVEELESALTVSVNTTQAEVDALEVYVAALEADIAVTYATIANLELLEARVATLGSAVDDINTAITNLESKDAELQALIESNDADITTLQEGLVDLATDLANEIARVDGVIEALAERVTANEESIVALNTTLAELTATVESIRVDLQSQIDTLGDEVDAIDVRLTAAEEKITAIEAELVEVWAEFETVRDEFAAADQAMYEKITAEYEAALIALEESLKTWTGEQLAVYWSQYFDLTNSVECDAFVDAMKALLTDSSENEWFVNQYELDAVIAALDQLESDFLNLKSEYEQYVADNDLAIEMINEKIDSINELITTILANIDDIYEQLKELGLYDVTLKALIDANYADIESLQNQIATLEEAYIAADDALKAELEAEILALQTTVADNYNSLSAQISGILADLEALAATDTSLQQQISTLSASLSTLSSTVQSNYNELFEYIFYIWKDLSSLQGQIDTITALLGTLPSEYADYGDAIVALENLIEDAVAAYQAADADLEESLLQEIADLKTELTNNLDTVYQNLLVADATIMTTIQTLETNLWTYINYLDGRVGAIEELIEYITYVPTNMWGYMTLSVGTYDWFDVNGDGGYDLAIDIPLYYNYVTVDGATTSTEYTTEATFRVYPAAKVADITAVTANVVEVTRATAYNVDVEILSYDETEGTITVEIATDYDYPTNAAANETISMAFDFTYDRGVVETTDEAGVTTTTTKYEEKVFQTDYVASVAIDGTPAVDATDVYYSNVDTDVADDGTVTYTNVWDGTTFTAFALNDKEIETTADYSVYYTTATELAADADLYVEVDGAFVALETLYDVTLDFVAPTTDPTYTGNRDNQYDFYATYVAISRVGYSGDKFVSDAYSIEIDGKTIASNISETILVVKSGDLSGLVYDLAWDYSTAVVASTYQTVDIDMLGELNTNAMTYTLANKISSYPEYDGTSNTNCYTVSIKDAQGNDVDPAVFEIDDVVFTIGTVAEGTAEIALTTSSSLVESATYYVTIEFWYKVTDEETASTITATVNVTGAPAIVYAGDDVDVYQTLSKTKYTFATVYDVYADYAKNATIDQFGSVAIFKEAMYGAIESNPNANGSNYTSYTDGSWDNAFYGGSVATDDLATDFYVGISAAYTTGGATVVRTYDYVDATGFSLSTTANLTVTSLEGSLVHNPTYVYVDSSDFYTTFFSSTLTAGNSSTLATLTTRDIETALLFDYDEIIADANPVVEITYELDAADASYATIADDANGDEHLYMASALSALEVTLTAYLWVNGIMVDSQVFDAVVVDPLADRATGLKVSSTFVTDGVLTMDIDDDYDLYDEFELMSINTGEYPLNDGFPYNIFGSTVGKTILTPLLGGDLYVDIVADPTNGDSRMLAYDSATQTLYYDYSTTPVLLEDQKFTVTITYEDKYTAELGATNTITFEVIVEKTATVN